MVPVCNKFYLFGLVQIQYRNLAQTCCQFGMQGISIENRQQLDCLLQAFKAADLRQRRSFLVPAMNENCVGRYQWCNLAGKPTVVPNLLLGNVDSSKSCLAIELDRNSAHLVNVPCSKMNNYICQANEDTIWKRNSIICPERAHWEACGNTYAFGYTKIRYISLARTCCDLGMRGLNIENNKQLECITQAFQGFKTVTPLD